MSDGDNCIHKLRIQNLLVNT